MRVLLLQPLGFPQVPLDLPHLPLHVLYRGQLPLQQTVEIVKVVLDVAADLVGLVPEPHVLLGQLDRLVYVAFVLFDQLLLLLQDQLDILVVLLAQLLDVLGPLGSAQVVAGVGVGVETVGSHEVVEVGRSVVEAAHVDLNGVGGVADGRDDVLDGG